MSEGPTFGELNREELLERLVERADVYTDEWNPHSRDAGRTILQIFTEFENTVRNQLDGVPKKQQIAFLDALDFERRPPQAARIPIRFHIPDDLDRNIVIPGGTQALAGGGSNTQLFELPQDGEFEVTSASLTDVIAIDPSKDTIVDHSAVVDSDQSVELFSGEDIQKHHVYLGNEDVLNLQPESTFAVSIETNVDSRRFADAVIWEYYGEDEDGTEGWHELVVDPETESEETADRNIEKYRQKLRSRQQAEENNTGTTSELVSGYSVEDPTRFEETFQMPGEPVVESVNGVESRWLRCRLKEPKQEKPFAIELRNPLVHVGSTDQEQGLDPDLLLSNDVPLAPEDGDIKPLGELPQPPTSLYISCEEAFTKPEGLVTLTFRPPSERKNQSTFGDDDDGDGYGDGNSSEGQDSDDKSNTGAGMGAMGGEPQLSWEYWNGSGWKRIDSIEDQTDAFRETGTVQFTVPEDIESTTVSGHENVWIRARLVSGNYGRPSLDMSGHDGIDVPGGDLDPPSFSDIAIDYEHRGRSFGSIFRHNNASYSSDLSEQTTSFSPFIELPDNKQTVYLGFDNTLRNGPLTLFLPMEDKTYPESFDTAIEWEYCVSPIESKWKELDVRDRTGGLTERGIVTLTVPNETTSFDLFDRDRHWIRLRVTQDEFDRSGFEQRASANTTRQRGRVVVDKSSRTTTPPVLEGIYPNTQWAFNKRTIEDEILGSSDGSHNQSFQCTHAPMIDIDVWVDELSTLSSSERRKLIEQHPDDIERTENERGDLTEFWVRWTRVDDFLDSGPSDRHYVANKTLGTIEFGDSSAGEIPPSGQDNIKATYTTGGGSDGNIEKSTVTDLESSISMVNDVTNPRAGDGGADAESLDRLVSRSTNQIRHRGKAVTPADYEQVALSEFRGLSKVKCHTLHDDGTKVIVIIVPGTDRKKPLPSMDLKQQVRDVLSTHAPATVVESDDMDIVVRGPEYAEVFIDARIRATNIKSVSLLKQTICDRLDEHLHPLTGNDGEGWSFGELPDAQELIRLVADVDEVSELLEVATYVDRNGEWERLSDRRVEVALPDDTLVCSGNHNFTIMMEDL